MTKFLKQKSQRCHFRETFPNRLPGRQDEGGTRSRAACTSNCHYSLGI